MIKKLTEGNPGKVLFFFTLPMLLGNIFQQLYNMADSLIVGRIVGRDGLAAVGASFGISFLAIGIATGASQGCAILISQCFGAKDYQKVKSGFSTSLIAVIGLGVLVTAASFFFLEPLLVLLQTPEDIMDSSLSYVRIIFIGCIFIFAYNCLTSIFNALGDSKTPLKFLIFSTLLNIGLDLLFVGGLRMGVNGAAYATIIAQITATCGLFVYFIKKMRNMDFMHVHAKFFDTMLFKNMIRIAIPSIIQQSMVSVGMMAVQGLVNTYGTDMVAGYTAATKLDSLAVMPILNIGIALSSYTAQNLGANIIDRIKKGYKAALIMIGVFSIAVTALIFPFGKYFINLFMDSQTSGQAIAYGTEYLQVVSIFYFLFGIMCVTNGILRGSGDMRFFMFSTLVNMTIRIAFAFVLTPVLGYSSIFWALPLGWAISGAISFIRYKSGRWKNQIHI